MKAKLEKYEDDDGRVICNMDVDGMRRPGLSGRREPRLPKEVSRGEPLTPSEARRYTWYAVRAGLVVVGVFSLTWVLFILFLTQIWAR